MPRHTPRRSPRNRTDPSNLPDNGVGSSTVADTPDNFTSTFDLWCGTPFLMHSIANRLESRGLRPNRNSLVKVIIDSPSGYALYALESLANKTRSREQGKASDKDSTGSSPNLGLRAVVVTFNMCCEYWEDLWDLEPFLLWVDPADDDDLLKAISYATHAIGAGHPADDTLRVDVVKQEQHRYKVTPGCTSPLATNERRVLRYLAQGERNETIGQKLNLHTKTVINISSDVYRKLHLENRMEALLYYWGLKPAQERHLEQVCSSATSKVVAPDADSVPGV